ncbi:MAG: hypothetical protein Ct9H300mP1_16810 [Planctomycetaceae bacterium]|nr:MAG: hypothetical protein Ct9H300mP1_16810 [Planctomycetaceae bacterium]
MQSQSLTVDRQIKRYGVPRLIFIKKLDRTGADPIRVCEGVRTRLGVEAVLMQLPIGLGADYEGVIDLVAMQAVYFDGDSGEELRREEIPESMQADAQSARDQLLERLAMFDDELMELCLSEDPVSEALIHKVVRRSTIDLDIAPVFLGSAYRNKGVQPLLDAVVGYLPSPVDSETTAFTTAGSSAAGDDAEADELQDEATGESADSDDAVDVEPEADEAEQTIQLSADPSAPLVAMTFKIVDDSFGQLTFTRIYQGTLERGGTYYNQRTRRKERFSRIYRMHAEKREEVDRAEAGDIVAVMGIDAASGDTYASLRDYCTLEGMFVPEPVIGVAVRTNDRNDEDRLTQALQRFRREDPTFRVATDPETNEVVIAGMGELHLEVYLERIRREYKVRVESGGSAGGLPEAPPQTGRFQPPGTRSRPVVPASSLTSSVDSRSSTGPTRSLQIRRQRCRRANSQAVHPVGRKGISGMPGEGSGGPLSGHRCRVELNDGSYHEVDSSDKAFQRARQPPASGRTSAG